MRKGQMYDTLKDDPRLSKKADEKVSLAETPFNAEALKSQKTRLADETTRSIPMPKGAQKFVNKFVEKAKAMHAEKDKLAAENVDESRIQEVAPEKEVSETAQVNVAPVEAVPVETTQVEAAQVETTQVEVAQVEAAQV